MDTDRHEPPPDAPDIVEEADEESFPASDAPARTVVTGTPIRPPEPGPSAIDEVDE
jgi:hypothetical protein